MSAPEAPAAPPAAPAPPKINDADITPASTEEALRIVLRKSLEVNGLVRGLSEVARTLDRKTAHLCILANDCEDASYKRLIEALCAQNSIDIIQVNERAQLAEWAGLVKKDKDGNIKNVQVLVRRSQGLRRAHQVAGRAPGAAQVSEQR
jgi:small subunit ribosomal protein S12e